MDPEVHQVLPWLYQENQWLHITYTLQRVINFRRRRVNSYFEEKTHQIQLINTPKLQFFFWNAKPLANYNLSPPIVTFVIYSVCLYSTLFFSSS